MAEARKKTDTAGAAAALLSAQVDELGAIDKELAPHRAKIARVEALRKAIRAHYDQSPAAAPFEAAGEKYVVLVGPRANQRTIGAAKLLKAIGQKMYAAIARVTLTDLEAHCSAEVCAAVITTEATGARSLKIFERGAAF